jgi:F0F1-type ATP synthase assembly protein I
VNAAAGLVAALQLAVAAVGGAGVWFAASRWVALSFVAGSGCALAGTAAYALCVAASLRGDERRVTRAHIVAEAAKVAVTVTLLIVGLNSHLQFSAAAYVAGFAAGVLVYPFALLLVNRKTDRN